LGIGDVDIFWVNLQGFNLRQNLIGLEEEGISVRKSLIPRAGVLPRI
jgi:hypothetical protein